MILELDAVETYYGDSHILQGLSLAVGEGEVVSLLGRNGAGKTTTMRSIVGLTPPRRGAVRFDGADISRRPTHAIARSGVAFVASGRRVFGSLTVRQNLELAARTLGSERSSPGTDTGSQWTVERVLDLFPKLHELMERRAEYLSGGEQQMVKLGRALLGSPRLLLLDEPTEGLSPAVVADLGRWLELLREQGMTILLTEQNALFALAHSDRGYVMEKGHVTQQDTASSLRDSPEIRASLGVG